MDIGYNSLQMGKAREGDFLLVPEDLVEGSYDEHDCSVLGARAACHRVLPREDPILALNWLCCTTRAAFNRPLVILVAWRDPSVWGTWLGPAAAAGGGAGGAGGLLDPHLHHFISPSAKNAIG